MMRALFGLALCIALALGVFLLWQSADPVQRDKREAAARYEQQRQALALEQERFALQQQQQAAVISTPAYGVLGFVYAALPLAVAVLALYIAHDAYKQRRTPLIHPDARGLLPVARVQIEQAQLTEAFTAALAAFHHTQALAATHQPMAERLTVHMKDSPAVAAPVAPALLTTAPEAPNVPDYIALADVRRQIKPGHIVFGAEAGGTLIERPFLNCYNGLGCGDTRTGKTNQFNAVIAQLHYMARRIPLQLYGADYKRELGATWGRSPLFVGGIQHDPQPIADMLDELVNGAGGVRARYATFERVATEHGRIITNISDFVRIVGTNPGFKVLILDELNALLEAAGKNAKVASNLKVLLQTGAGAGVFTFGGAQYLTAATLGRDASKQFTTRILFGAYDRVAVDMLYGKVDHDSLRANIDGRQGRGLIRVAGQAQPVAFQALRCDEGDILDAIASVAPPRSTRENATATDCYEGATEARYTALECGETSLLSSTTKAPVSPATVADNAPEVAVSEGERLSILSALEELSKDGKKPSLRAVCRRVFDCEGGTPFKKVQAVISSTGL